LQLRDQSQVILNLGIPSQGHSREAGLVNKLFQNEFLILLKSTEVEWQMYIVIFCLP
jgi:hypothetical protein